MPKDYPALFRTYLGRRLRQMQTVVESDAFVRSHREQERALRLLDYALAEPVEPAATCTLLTAMAPKMEMAGYRDEWRSYLLRGIEFSRRFEAAIIEAELANELGVLYQRQSMLAEAEKWLRFSANHYGKLNHSNGRAKALNQLAFLAYLRHDYDAALQLTQCASTLIESDPIIQAMSYFVEALVAGDFGRWSESEAKHRRALYLRQEGGDLRRTAWSLMDLAGTLRRQERYTEAIDYYQQSASLLESINDVYFWAHVQMNLGLTKQDQGDIGAAFSHFSFAQTEWEKHGDLLNLARLYTNMGLEYLASGRPSKAEAAFCNSIELYRHLKDDSGALNATDGLAMALLAQQRYTDAIARLEQGLSDLTKIADQPAYSYLLHSMQQHLQEAQRNHSVKNQHPPLLP